MSVNRSNRIPYGIFLMALFLTSLFLDSGCTNSHRQEAIGKHSIYHWKTTYNDSPQDSAFLERHNIRRIYMHLFDVDCGYDYDGSECNIPKATTRFLSSVPSDVEIVPVVYITTSAIYHDITFVKKMYQRIHAMCRGNRLGAIKEIQLDCDWTQYCRDDYFQLCQEFSKLAHADSIVVSATIRLHQLKDKVPPVDRGVLMLYNTGSLYDISTQNSIISYSDVKPYLSQNLRYDLPLSLAFPTYSWSILFKNGKFNAILRCTDFSNRSLYRCIGKNRYTVLAQHELEGHYLHKGDIIRVDLPYINDIVKVKRLALNRILSPISESIIYHLDSLSLSQFTPSQINNILQ